MSPTRKLQESVKLNSNKCRLLEDAIYVDDKINCQNYYTHLSLKETAAPCSFDKKSNSTLLKKMSLFFCM